MRSQQSPLQPRHRPLQRACVLQGDVLSGTLAAFTAWTVNSKDGGAAAAQHGGVPPLLLAAYGATRTVRHASEAILKPTALPDASEVTHPCRFMPSAPRSSVTVARDASPLTPYLVPVMQAAFKQKRRSMLAADVIEELGGIVDRLSET